ncbi:MAG TPA: glycerophosphodiester phosphodiesterase [Acidimicrobiales bacterium]|nr:glycerophosphodiester phosphodiesterase [Acidimicrobiales bacterium]
MARFPFLDWPGPLAFAHQGAHSPSGPGENTMAAFEAAVAMGYRYLETDVHATADNVVVAFHDDRLDRLTDRTGLIADLPWAEVKAARVRGRDEIPRIEDVLTAWPDVRVNLDPKHDRAVAPLADLLERTGALDRVCIGAFSDRRLTRLRDRLDGRVCMSMGPRQVGRLVAASGGLRVGPFTAACVQVPGRRGPITLVTERFVAAAHARDMQVHVWTVNDADEMRRLLDLGVDGIMTDACGVLKAVLEERGAWVA